MPQFADLHIHTYYSDGASSPEEVVEDACREELRCIAITDHDTLDGVALTVEAGKKRNLEVIAGVEMSSSINGKDVHVLGYMMDYKSKRVLEKLSLIQDNRITRMKMMIEKLSTMGISNISFEEVKEKTQSNSIGRPHLAQLLVEKGVVSSIKEAFERYLAEGAPAHISVFKQSPYDAVRSIKETGGVAVLAHPMITNVDELIPGLVKAGLDGIEVYYPNCGSNVTNFYLGIAKKHGLIITGGSDAHGVAKKNTYVGKVKVPYEVVEQLKERAGSSQ